MRSTHTFALLDLPKAMYEFIRDKMKAAGYEHAFLEDGSIDMHGIGLSVDEDSAFLQSISNPPVAFSENGALFWYGDPAERRDFTGDLYAAQDDYRRAVDEALVVRHLGVASGDARSDLKRVLDWDVAAALDPAVSSDAQALIDRGRSQLDLATEITGASRYAEPRASAEEPAIDKPIPDSVEHYGLIDERVGTPAGGGEMLPRFSDPDVQTVYQVLCKSDSPPPGEHWEGYAARLIVQALRQQCAEEGPSDADLLLFLEQQDMEALPILSLHRDRVRLLPVLRALLIRYAEPQINTEAEQEAYARGLRKAARIADAKARRVNSAWIAQDIAHDIRTLIPEN